MHLKISSTVRKARRHHDLEPMGDLADHKLMLTDIYRYHYHVERALNFLSNVYLTNLSSVKSRLLEGKRKRERLSLKRAEGVGGVVAWCKGSDGGVTDGQAE